MIGRPVRQIFDLRSQLLDFNWALNPIMNPTDNNITFVRIVTMFEKIATLVLELY